jgi:hypothetical protein
MMFSNTSRRTNATFVSTNFRMNIMPSPQTVIQPTVQPPAHDQKKMIWGEPTWFFLHTIAHKVRDFNAVRVQLLGIIYQVCTNLPCPMCSQHAKTYLDSINFNTIQTREQLKQMLFTFHNVVNTRKGYSLFSSNELDAKYALAVTRNIFSNFIGHFKDSHRSPGMIADDLFRSRLALNFIAWFNTNRMQFDD